MKELQPPPRSGFIVDEALALGPKELVNQRGSRAWTAYWQMIRCFWVTSKDNLLIPWTFPYEGWLLSTYYLDAKALNPWG
jgi:hypothetical protein